MNKTEWLLIMAALFPWACVAAASWITPRVTRPDLFFAVTVRPSFRASPEGARILKRYDCLVAVAAVAGLLPLVFLKFPHPWILPGLLGPVVVELAGWLGAFVVARHRTMPFHVEATAQREAQLTLRKASLPGGWLAQAGPFLILGAVSICLWLNWDRIPARIPVHWGAEGEPNGWANKNVASVFGCPTIGAMTCLLMLGISWAVTGGVRRIHSSGGAAVREGRFVRAVLFFVLAMSYWLAGLFGLIGLAALRWDVQAPIPQFWLILPAEGILIAVVFAIAYRMGQGGWRSGGGHEKNADDAPPVGDRTPDECWKMGLFYFNPNDPATIVEKRFGIGWTLNFANWASWLVIGAVMALMLVIMGVALMAGR
jgi:uncharacterized membrane protein